MLTMRQIVRRNNDDILKQIKKEIYKTTRNNYRLDFSLCKELSKKQFIIYR